MDRPQANATSKAVQPPPRRRIVPTAVAPQDQAPASAAFDAEQPLVVPPPPSQGSSKHISASGQGRRIWVDIHNTIEVKFKEVLRQQGLEYKTWRAAMQQRRAQLDTAAGAQGADARRQGLSAAGVYQRTQGMYEVLESDGEEEDDDEEDSGSDGPPAEGGVEEGDAAGSSGDNEEEDEEDDEEEDKGNDTAGEVDLEKEEAAARKAPKPKRQRFERYDDDFIDDSELEMVKGGGPTKTKFSGFYVTQGNVETIEEPSKPRAKPKPRQPKNADAAAAAATAGGTGPGRKRKQPEKAQEQQEQQQQQQQQLKKKDQQQDGEAAAVGSKKKRQRSETPAGAGAAAGAAASQEKLPAGKRVKPVPVPPAAPTAATAAAGALQQPGVGSAEAAGPSGSAAAAAAAAAAAGTSAGGTAAKAMAGIQAALAARKKPRSADSTAGAAAAPAVSAAPAAGDDSNQQQQQDANTQRQPPVEQPAAASAPAATAEAMIDAAEAAAAAAAGGAVTAAAAAGLSSDVVAAVEALQKEVAEHKPPAPGGPGKSAGMSKAVRHALDGLGLTFARLPAEVREQQTAALVSVLGPLMLPYFKEKKLRRILLEEAASRAGELQGTRQALFEQLQECLPAGGAAAAGGTGDEDFQPHMSAAAEEALAAAWAAHQTAPEQLTQLAVDVCAKLGWANVQPDKAVAELKQIIKQAKKRMSKSKPAATPGAAAAAAAGALSQQPSLQRQVSGSLVSSRQSPEPSAAAAGDTSGGGTPGLTPQRQQQQQQQQGLAPIALASQGPSGSGAGSGSGLQKQPAEKFSTMQAPSPRLQRCLDAAVAAGAPLEWLQEKYPSLRSRHMHQLFRTLCVSGPAGCPIKAMVGRAAEHELGMVWEDTTAARSALKQSLAGAAMSGVAGTTEADSKAYALLCFPGVRKQPAKPPKGAPEAAAGAQLAAE